jgi:hypothetical protein
VGRILIRETYRYALIAAICTLRRLSVPIIPTAFDAVTVRAAVVMKVLLRVTHGYTQTVHLCRDTEQVGREVTRRLRADMKRVKTRALEAPPSVAKAS